MLPIGFLAKLSNWTAEQVYRDKVALEKASDIFGLREYLGKTDQTERIAGLFSEWLVFDYQQKIFDGFTGLEYFARNNPLNLPDNDIRAYQDLLGFEVGFFEAMSVEAGKGVVFLSIASGNKNFVRDVNASLFLRSGDTVWARIALVGEDYYIVGSIFIPFPIKIMGGMREAISEWEKNSFDARAIASWTQRDGRFQENSSGGKTVFSYQEAERNFTEALRRCGMENFFTLETYKEWAANEDRYNLGFTIKALYYLIPDNASNSDTDTLIKAAGEFANVIPRKFLKGQTPNEAILDETTEKKRKWELDIFSKEKYIKDLELASEYLAKGDFQLSYKTFEQVVKNLLKDKIPFFGIFRIYANTAVCCFHKDGSEMLGEELLHAALRINPLYDFAMQCKEKYIDLTDDFSGMSKKEIKIMTQFREEMKATGKRQYQHRVFSKYEKFLKDIGVSLEYKTKTVTTVYTCNKDGSAGWRKLKIGRNEPCYCSSGKKYKKCHGA